MGQRNKNDKRETPGPGQYDVSKKPKNIISNKGHAVFAAPDKLKVSASYTNFLARKNLQRQSSVPASRVSVSEDPTNLMGPIFDRNMPTVEALPDRSYLIDRDTPSPIRD